VTARRVCFVVLSFVWCLAAPSSASAGAAHAASALRAHSAALHTSRGGSAGQPTTGSGLGAGADGLAADPLAANGFESPSCTTASLFAQISPTARLDCQVSGVAVAPVPLSNYSFDTNINSALGASLDDEIDTIVQELLLTPVWTALVWLIHVAVVALEWCYAIDLLAPGVLGQMSAALRRSEQIFTEPWLGLALALAGIAFVWHGLVRRRVAETLGQAAVMLAMMSIGLWIIADPAGTVGAVGHLADEAALGTLAATATGDANQPSASLETSLGEIFDSAITGPWCYLEFGDVDWCRDPSQLDPRLAATGRQLESLYRAGATCGGAAPGLVQCPPGGSDQQRAFAATALALSTARTNGALFLALPPNSLGRNALSSETALPSLFATLCGANGPTNCSAGTGPQAEFRTAQGTWARAGGLLLIAVGVAGMLAMLGFIALRLLGAALAVIIYLLLAPIAVLAPAAGDGGRNAFRQWFLRLAGATLAKLVYSVLLGVTLLIVRLLTSLNGLGWWTQWLLISVFWWLAFEHRHRILGFVIHERGEPTSRASAGTRLRHSVRAVRAGAGVGHAAGRKAADGVFAAHDVWQQVRDYSGNKRTRPPSQPTRPAEGAARAQLAAQVDRAMSPGQVTPSVAASRKSAIGKEIVSLRGRRTRLATEETAARLAGAERRAVSLALRGRHVDAEIAARTNEITGLGAAESGGWAQRRRHKRDRMFTERALDREARAVGSDPSRLRNHAALAGLAGLTPAAYERQSAGEHRQSRVQIERELDLRRAWLNKPSAESQEGVEGVDLRGPGASSPREAPRAIGHRRRQFRGRAG
jgi:hypothetical protein